MILVVRHGETAWNAERRFQGQKDSPLTERGRRQAKAMAGLVGDLVRREPEAGWRLVSSPLGRAHATAEAVAAATGLPLELDPRLAEIHFGDWEGLSRDAIAAQAPEVFANREWYFCPPGGETYEDVMARVQSWLAELPPEPHRRVVAVTHGVTSRLLRGAYANLDRETVKALDVPQDAVWRLMAAQIDRLDCEPVD